MVGFWAVGLVIEDFLHGIPWDFFQGELTDHFERVP